LAIILFIIIDYSHASDLENPKIEIGQRVKIVHKTTVTAYALSIFPYKTKKVITIVGELMSIDSDTILLRSETVDGSIITVITSNVKKLYFPNGKHRALKEGAGAGMLVGAIWAVISIGGITDPYERTWVKESPGETALAYVGGGIIIGGIVGSLFKTTRWKKLIKEDWPVELKVTNKENRLGVGLTFNF